MIPLKDDLPTHSFPLITVGFILLNIAAFFYQVSLGPAADGLLFAYGAIPFNLMHIVESGVSVPTAATSLFTSMFLHGDIMHLGGNMLYLWIFGNNIEDIMGRSRFIVFYLICGVAAVYTHSWMEAQSRIPMIGASGAVSGILGAYLLQFPRARVLTLVPLGFFMTTIRIPALIMIGFWFAGQIANSLFVEQGAGGIAWFAHVGGFVAGLMLIPFFKK
jgi:membrane associated rhomboid family serine protease